VVELFIAAHCAYPGVPAGVWVCFGGGGALLIGGEDLRSAGALWLGEWGCDHT
jgi:hypothetical protein